MTNGDNKFDEYLDGHSTVSAQYAELGEAGPPAELDAVILAEAKRAAEMHSHATRTRRWVVPVSLAATVMICFSLVLNILREAPTGIDADQSIDVIVPADRFDAPARAKAQADSLQPAAPAEKKASASTGSVEAAAESPQVLLRDQSLEVSRGRMNSDAGLAGQSKDEAATAAGFAMPEVSVTGKIKQDNMAEAPLAVSIYRLDDMESEELIILGQMIEVVTDYLAVDAAHEDDLIEGMALPAADGRSANRAVEQSAYSGLASLSSADEKAGRSEQDKAVMAEPDSELQRIAGLYAQSQNTDAAAALAEFREAFPDHAVSRLLLERGY